MKATEEELTQATALVTQLRAVQGEKRVVYRCNCCQRLFAHRFIPFGLGRGMSLNKCLCQLTANRMHLTTVILECTP